MGRARTSVSRRAARGRAWAALLLLALVVLLPAVTVGWLVLKAVENRRIAVAKIVEDARRGFLEAGAAEVGRAWTGWREAFEAKLRGGDPGDWRAVAFASGEVDGFLVAEDFEDRERLREPFELLKAVEAEDAPVAARRLREELRSVVMTAWLRGEMPLAQAAFLLRRLADLGADAEVERARDFAHVGLRWLALREQAGGKSPESAEWWMADLLGVALVEGQATAVLRADRVERMLAGWLAAVPARAGGRLALEGVGDEDGGAAVALAGGHLRLPEPFAAWRIAFVPAEGGDALSGIDREVYWLAFVGAAVVGLSCLLAVFLHRVMRREARLAELKNDLVATVSHELKTPVASIRLLVDTLLRDGAADPRRVREYLELISRENRRLGHLISNFLSFSRMERDRDSFELEPADPGQVAAEAARVFHERHPEWGGTLEVDSASGLPRIRADAEALGTALGNLLDNARKYGGSNRWIRLGVRRDGEAVVFSVEDRGIGIAPEDQRRIFERFYQAHTRLSDHVGGVGLGLSIVEFVVRKHAGCIELESTPGEGSVFTIRIPAMKEDL